MHNNGRLANVSNVQILNFLENALQIIILLQKNQRKQFSTLNAAKKNLNVYKEPVPCKHSYVDNKTKKEKFGVGTYRKGKG